MDDFLSDKFFPCNRAFSKLNFLIHLKSKTNLVTLIKLNSHLQYYDILNVQE